MESFIQFLTVVVIFIFVLLICYLTTRWVGNIQKSKYAGGNIELIEAAPLTQNQHVQIVRVGDKYFALAVSKDSIESLGEISPDSLCLSKDELLVSHGDSFQKILEQAKKVLPHK